MVVHIGLDQGERRRIDRAGLREVEAQAFGRDEAALLRDVKAEPLAQRLVQQVRRAVVRADAVAARAIDCQVKRVADGDLTLGDRGHVREQAAEILPRILDLADNARRGERASIADLPAALGIEGRLVEQDLYAFARTDALDARAVLDDSDDLPLTFLGGVADEFGAAGRFRDVEPHVV